MIGILVASWVIPVALERTDVLASTWSVSEGSIRVTSSLAELGGTTTSSLLVGANIVAIVVIGLFANALARSRRDAQRKVEIQAWHLQQLLPSE